MKKNLKIIILIFFGLILFIIAFVLFNLNKKEDYKRDPSIYGIWFKEKIEFYAGGKMHHSQDKFADSYININRTDYQVCFSLNNEATCEHYKYSAQDGYITIYNFMDLEEAKLTYRKTEDGFHLIFRFDDEGYDSYYIDTYKMSSG